MTKEATQEGVSESLEGGFDKDPRESVYAAHDKQMAEDPDLKPIEEEEEERDTEVKAEEEEQPEGEVEQDASDDEPTDEEEETITIKVDGEEMEVPLSQVRDAGVRTLQKQTAADKRLEEATRLKLQVEQLEQRLAAAPQAPVSEVKVEPKSTPDEIRQRLMEIDRKIAVEGVQTEQEFSELQQERMQLMDDYYDAKLAAGRQMDAEVQQRQAMAEAQENLGRTVGEKYDSYKEDMFLLDDNGGQIEDPRRPGMAALNPKFEAFLAEKPPMFAQMALASTDPADALFVLDQFYASQQPVADLSAKREKKKSIDNIETAKTSAKPKEKKKAQSDDDYIRSLKKSRGQGDYDKPHF